MVQQTSLNNLEYMVQTRHQPPLKLNIDFENGILHLKGTRTFRYPVQLGVKIRALQPITLANNTVIPLEGKIMIGNAKGSCSGLLLIDKVRTDSGVISSEWTISIYFDDNQQNMEIKLQLPLLIDTTNAFELLN